MNIYSIEADSNKYQLILPVSDSVEVFEMLDFTGLPKEEKWKPIEFYIDNPLNKQSDFYSLINTAALACNKNAIYKLGRFWDLSAELLPIYLENGEELFIVNIIDCVNALATNDTEYDYYEDGTRSNRILKYSFHENRFHESSIFKIPETANIQILTYTGLKSLEDEFYTAYQQSGLAGLIFEEIYSSQLGAD
jgi:hypothetical protein